MVTHTSRIPDNLRRDPNMSAVIEVARTRGRVSRQWLSLAAGAWGGIYEICDAKKRSELFADMVPTPDLWEPDFEELTLYYPVLAGAPTLPPTPGWKLFFCWWAAVSLGADRDTADFHYLQAARDMQHFNAALVADGLREELDPVWNPAACDRWFTIIESHWHFDDFPLLDIIDEEICRPAMTEMIGHAALRLVGSEPLVGVAGDTCRACGQSAGHADRCRIGLREKVTMLTHAAMTGGDHRA